MGVFVPIRAQAGFFSSILGDEVSASDELSSENSQNNALALRANVSSASIFKDKNVTKDDQIDETINVDVSGNALVPKASSWSAVDGTDALDSSCGDISFYPVKSGDTISKVAKLLGVSENTVLAANDMKKKLMEDDVLFIPDISGVNHTVIKGQTMQSIAKFYKADINDIAFCNGIAPDAKLKIGVNLMIPGGKMADEGGDKPASNLSSSVAKDINYYITHPIQNLIGYFINPVPTGHKTQGLHGPGHRGIDIGAPTGTEIYASASGTVIIVKTGCKVGKRSCGSGYGNMVVIQHPNGTKTLYAHMSKVIVHIGDQVNQGQVIGYVGSTGKSTGPHIHFETFYTKNPGSDNSWATNQLANN